MDANVWWWGINSTWSASRLPVWARADTNIYSAWFWKTWFQDLDWGLPWSPEGPDSVACCAHGIALVEEKRMEVEVRRIFFSTSECGMWIQAQGSPERKRLTWASHSVLSLDTQVSHKKRKYDTNGRSNAWRCLVAVPEKNKNMVPEMEAWKLKMVASAFATWNPKMFKKWFPKWKPQMLKKWFRKWKPKMSRKLGERNGP